MQRNKIQGVVVIEGHVQGLSITRSLGETGVPVVVVDSSTCIAKYSRFCHKTYKCPPYESDDLAHFLIDLAKEKALEGWLLMPSNDHAVLTLSRNKEQLLKYFKIITPDLEIVEKIYDKSKLMEIAEKVKVPIPKSYYIDDPGLNGFDMRFPVLIKGRNGLDFYKAMKSKAYLSETVEQLQKHIAIIGRTISVKKAFIQELIPYDGTNRTVSFCAFCENGEIKTFWAGVKLREHPIRFGTATYAQSVYLEECYQLSIPLLRALNYTGVCEVEYLRDPRDGLYKLIEINPRTWLWVELAKACGVDFARIVYNFKYERDIVFPHKYEVKTCWINPFTDTVYSLISFFTGKLDIEAYINSIFRNKNIDALFKKGDIKPAIAYFFLVLSFLRRR